MIELKNDELKFSFPQVREQLRELKDAYAAEVLARILGEDRGAAVEEAMEHYPEGKKYEMLRLVRGLSREEVAKGFKKALRAAVREALEDVHPGTMSIDFQRTLRIPDDGDDHHLPPGLDSFPLRHIDDFGDRVPAAWRERGGVLMPMYQSEALWLCFNGSYPFAVKIGSGKINAVSGEPWRQGIHRDPQDYLVLPEQPWLDGFAVAKGIIRQFVAMPLGAGYSVEEQLTGRAEFGGLQIQVVPMKASAFFEREIRPMLPSSLAEVIPYLMDECDHEGGLGAATLCCASPDMGLGAGGRMLQEIYEDPHDFEDWDQGLSSRCFVHLCNSLVWREITGTNPPHPPVTAEEYERSGLPWFDFYRDDVTALDGSGALAGLKSTGQISQEKSDQAIATQSVKASTVIRCGPAKRPSQVREWRAD